MRRLYLASILLTSISLLAQTHPASRVIDAQALQIVNAVIAASGGAAVANVHDFAETGILSFNWGTQEVRGSANILSIGTTDFRLDTALGVGDWSWYVSRGQGKLKTLDGKISKIPFHAGVNRGALSLPVLRLAKFVADQNYSITYAGQQQDGARTLNKLHVERVSSGSDVYAKTIANLETADYLIDSLTYQIVRIEDTVHPLKNMNVSQPHLLDFADYRTVEGLQVPFSITEHIENARTWSLQITDVKINTGIADSDISF